MKFYGILNDDGEIIKKSFCPDDCDIITALGHFPEPGTRYTTGRGETEQDAEKSAKYSFTNTIN